jgi:hypothetical protein
MIRFGTIGYVKEIEAEICKLPNELLYDGSEPLTEPKKQSIQNNGVKVLAIKAYIKWYEIFETEQAKRNTIHWLNTKSVFPKYRYDYRANEASIEISDEGITNLCRRLPRLKQMIDEKTTWQKKLVNPET